MKYIFIISALLISCVDSYPKKKIITNFLKNSDVMAGAVKWSSAIGGSKQKKPWALLLKSDEGIFNCYLTFSQSDIESLTCDRYDY